jgi:hypothetical protein
MIRGASVALPTIMTLHSGTALAMTSAARMMPSTQAGQVGDNVVCLDVTNLQGPPYAVPKGTQVKAVPVAYRYVSTADLAGVDLTKPSHITNAISQKGLTPLRADQLCRSQGAGYVPVTYKTNGNGGGSWEPLQRNNATVVGVMPPSANMSALAFNSMDAAKQITTKFLV